MGDVRHSCDNPPCCNPLHLFDGTTQENILDMETKGRARHPSGSRNGRAVVTEDMVRAIRADARSQAAIGAEYGISQVQVSHIKRRIHWAHVQD